HYASILGGYWPAYLFSNQEVGQRVAPVSMSIGMGGAGHGGNAHAANEYYIIEGAGKVYGMAGAEKVAATKIHKFRRQKRGRHHQADDQLTDTPIIRARGLTKIYRVGDMAIHALRGITIDIAPGEFVSVVGPSGSGKSTFMHILGCLDTPTAGEYLLAGRD